MKSIGIKEPDILFILEPMSSTFREFFASSSGKKLVSMLKSIGVSYKKCSFIVPCPFIPVEISKSEKQKKEFIQAHKHEFLGHFNSFKPKSIIFVGAEAGFQLFQEKVKITKHSGIISEHKMFSCPYMGLISIRNSLLYQKQIPTLEAHMKVFKRLVDNDYKYSDDLFLLDNVNYYWSIDISDILENRPKIIAFDTETTGLSWHTDYPIVYQMTRRDGESILSPIHESYFPEYFSNACKDIFYFIDILCGQTPNYEIDYKAIITKIQNQWKEIIEDPSVKKMGHNIKFDMHMAMNLGHELKGLQWDTLQMLWSINENLPTKNLDDAVKIYVPEMVSYADVFNKSTDKSDMMNVEPSKMIYYAGGDTDATYRLSKALYKEAIKDKSNFRVFQKVKMPAIACFFKMERTGIRVDVNKLESIQEDVSKELNRKETEILKTMTPEVRRKFMFGKKNHDKDPLNLSRSELVQEAMFGSLGLDLEPMEKYVKQDGTPSLNKDHLGYFVNSGYELVDRYVDYKKTLSFKDKYIGSKDEEKGTWKYLHKNDKGEHRVHSTFNIHTDTGRCVPDGTKIIVRKGKKITKVNIEDIKIGDTVLTGNLNWKRVTAKYDNGYKEVLGITTSKGKEVWATAKHKFMDDKGKWKVFESFDIDDYIMVFDNKKIKKEKIVTSLYNRNKLHTWDIEVEDDHSYIANMVVSHNSNSKEPNVQNTPSKGSLAKSYKSCIITSPDSYFLTLDYSQMELRCIAWAAVERTLIKFYSQGADIHSNTAAQILAQCTLEEFKLLDSTVRKDLRSKAKIIIFGFMYGLLPKGFTVYAKLLGNVEFSLDEAEVIRDTILNVTYPRLGDWHEEVKAFAHKHKYVKSLHGSTRHLPHINSHDKWVVLQAERQSINSCIQEFGSDMGLLALQYIDRDFNPKIIKPINFIHDALYFEVKKEYALPFASYVKYYMENIPLKKLFNIESPVPFVAEADMGVNWADCYMMSELSIKSPEKKEKEKFTDLDSFKEAFGYNNKDIEKYFTEESGQYSLKAIKPEFCRLGEV